MLQRYIIIGLCAALLTVCGLYAREIINHADTKSALSLSEAVNASNHAEIVRLERSMSNTDKVLAGWSEDRTTLAEVRNATRQAVKEAMRDETFKAWASSAAPGNAWRLLRETDSANRDCPFDPADGTACGLPGNADTGKRQ